MSRVYFHSQSGTAELLGAERAHASIVSRDVALGAMAVFRNRDRLLELLNPDHHFARHRTTGEMLTWADRFGTYLDEAAQADYRDERRADLWGELPEEERWRTALEGLRARNETKLLELKPDTWSGFRFGHTLSAIDLQADDWQERLDEALGLEPDAVS
ncbi:hypothetical protein [Spirillospora sp. CA-294931]|uniref:hypothetical protein n=1 Tax=Spirillospora sp. CA-294931 TaxID=3240042 RepID=UPI003D8F9414